MGLVEINKCAVIGSHFNWVSQAQKLIDFLELIIFIKPFEFDHHFFINSAQQAHSTHQFIKYIHPIACKNRVNQPITWHELTSFLLSFMPPAAFVEWLFF